MTVTFDCSDRKPDKDAYRGANSFKEDILRRRRQFYSQIDQRHPHKLCSQKENCKKLTTTFRRCYFMSIVWGYSPCNGPFFQRMSEFVAKISAIESSNALVSVTTLLDNPLH